MEVRAGDVRLLQWEQAWGEREAGSWASSPLNATASCQQLGDSLTLANKGYMYPSGPRALLCLGPWVTMATWNPRREIRKGPHGLDPQHTWGSQSLCRKIQD